MGDTASPAEAFRSLCDVIVRLRSPGGCPWDREQTPLSLRGSVIEETYECIEAIDEGDTDHIREELGDVLFLAVMIAYMHEQEGKFTVADVVREAAEKLVRRHPHVFAGAEAKDSSQAIDNWVKVKVETEGRRPKDSILDEVSRGLPPLDRSWKLQKKAAKAGFDWPDAAGVISKVKEELDEAEEAARDAAAGGAAGKALEEELGDLLFSAVNLCRWFDVEPSVALQRTNIKFTGRFKHVEKRMRENGAEMKKENLPLMDRYWEEAKQVSLLQNPVGFGQALGKTGQKPGFSPESKEAVPKTEVLEQPHVTKNR
jgi:tetrapyrrole methylase family protein/MazG family protein